MLCCLLCFLRQPISHQVTPEVAGGGLLRKRGAVTDFDRGAVKMRGALEARTEAVTRLEESFTKMHSAYLAKKKAGTTTRPEALLMAKRYRAFKARKGQVSAMPTSTNEV